MTTASAVTDGNAIADDELRAALGANLTRARKKVGGWAKAARLHETFQNKWLAALVGRHPTRKVDAGRVGGFVKAKRAPYNRACLFAIVDGETRDFGWVLCLRNLYGKHDRAKLLVQKAKAAFRAEAFGSALMQAARSKIKVGPCSACERRCKLVIDHDGAPFAQIVDEFLEAEGLGLRDVALEWSRGQQGFRCRRLAERWRAFHDTRAELVGLCQSCNCAKGSGGYRHRPAV
jgi:hypothetical protein